MRSQGLLKEGLFLFVLVMLPFGNIEGANHLNGTANSVRMAFNPHLALEGVLLTIRLRTIADSLNL